MLATVAAWRVLCVVGVAWVGLWCVVCCGVGLACGGVVGLDRIGLGCWGLSGWVGFGWVGCWLLAALRMGYAWHAVT